MVLFQHGITVVFELRQPYRTGYRYGMVPYSTYLCILKMLDQFYSKENEIVSYIRHRGVGAYCVES
jgi:hypothetical protein